MHGEFFWYDVMTSDTAAAAKFYEQVVGWTARDSGAPGQDYTVFSVDGRGVAGLMPIPDSMGADAQPCWFGYIAVDDVDASAANLQAEGGAVHRGPIEVPGVIRFAVVSDPQGAVFLIAKGLSREAMPEISPKTPGAFSWRELYAGDWETVFGFYERMFGWKKVEAHDMGPMGIYQLFSTGAEPVGGMMNKPGVIPRPHWAFYTTVESINAAAERVKAAGGVIRMGPHQVPGGDWIVQCVDPQGASFALTAAKA